MSSESASSTTRRTQLLLIPGFHDLRTSILRSCKAAASYNFHGWLPYSFSLAARTTTRTLNSTRHHSARLLLGRVTGRNISSPLSKFSASEHSIIQIPASSTFLCGILFASDSSTRRHYIQLPHETTQRLGSPTDTDQCTSTGPGHSIRECMLTESNDA